MSHRDDCPTRLDVERRADSDFRWSGYKSYAPSEYDQCDEAQRDYEYEMSRLREREEQEIAEQRAAQRRREEEDMMRAEWARREEQAYWEEEERRHYEALYEEQRANEKETGAGGSISPLPVNTEGP